MKNRLLWLDDIRDPRTENWLQDYAPEFIDSGEVIWVKSFKEFKEWIIKNGTPTKVAFDHDLGENIAREMVSKGVNKKKARLIKKEAPSGYEASKWLVDHCLKNSLSLPEYVIQSANPIGRENIKGYLENAKKHLGI